MERRIELTLRTHGSIQRLHEDFSEEVGVLVEMGPQMAALESFGFTVSPCCSLYSNAMGFLVVLAEHGASERDKSK